MQQLREYIRKEISKLKEATVKLPLPNDAKNTLMGVLKLKKTHINNIQAIKAIKPAYRIYLNNNQSFVIKDLGNNFGFGLVVIDGKEYDLLDNGQKQLALQALYKLQTNPVIKTTGDEEGSTEDSETKEPTEEPAEEPAEEPEA